MLGKLGLSLKPAKTQIVPLQERGEGFDLLGFHHRYVRGRTPRSQHLTFLVCWPSRQAMQHARNRVREINRPRASGTARRGHRAGPQPVSASGWAAYFRYGSSAQFFDKISRYAMNRLAIFVAHRINASAAGGGGPSPANPQATCG